MRITVTGAGGHIGGNVVRALLDENRPGVRIRALVHDSDRALASIPSGPAGAIDVARCDLLDPEATALALDGSEVVYHLAARISLEARDAEVMERINVGGTRNVLAACARAGVRRLVYFSSVHAFSTRPHDAACDETRPLSDGDDDAPAYDKTKARALRLVREAAAGGLDAVAIHPTGVIGPHDYAPSAMGRVIRDLATGRLPALVSGGFNFVDVRDVAALAIAAEQRGRRGESYLAAGEWISVREIAAVLERVSGRRAPRFSSPMWLARASAPLVVGLSRLVGATPLFTPASLHALRTHRTISHDKATRELGYAPRPIADSFADTVAWMRAAGTLR